MMPLRHRLVFSGGCLCPPNLNGRVGGQGTALQVAGPDPDLGGFLPHLKGEETDPKHQVLIPLGGGWGMLGGLRDGRLKGHSPPTAARMGWP